MTGQITGIELDMDSKPDFCEPCSEVWRTGPLGPARTNSTSSQRRVILLGPTNGMRHLSRHNRAIKSKYRAPIEGENSVHDSPPQNGVAERGMRTRAELARALLISSGLPRFLWEEAMKHVEWVKERSLAGIHEFGAAAYVKDLKAGKLDARALLGRFVGYDSESKGFRIYWPTKRSVTVERNVIFNDGDVTADATAVIPGDLSEGEKEKIIQMPENNRRRTEDDVIKDAASEPHIEINPNPSVDPEPQNTIPFPSAPDLSNAMPQEPIADEQADE